MYFNNFEQIYYDFNIKGKSDLYVVTDITKNIRFRKEILSNITLYDEYDIIDGETPEIIAEKVYGNPTYHWVVMLANDRYNYLQDFPLSQYELLEHTIEKYGAGNEYSVHHYIDENGFIVDQNNVNFKGITSITTSVSNYEYEDAENEKKRRIKIVSPEIINTVLKNFIDL
jgi:hypothetical protein